MNVLSLAEAADVFPKSGFEKLVEDASFGDRLAYGLKITAIGMLIVFSVLAFLCIILYGFKLFSKLSQKKAKNTAQTAVSSAAAANANATTADDDEQTVVAIATAAIAASRNESEAAFKVISITKIN